MTWDVATAKDIHGNEGLWIAGDHFESVCDLYTYHTDIKDGRISERKLVPFENAEQNAQLIAAAPELLSLLGEIRGRVNSYGLVTWMDRRFWNRVDEVLEKATNDQHQELRGR